MAQLLGIRIKNFKSLADVTLGQIGSETGDPLPSMCCFIGPNGCGKSSLLDAFGFLSDCLKEGVEAACDKPQRGGFQKLRTQGSSSPITFLLSYKVLGSTEPIVYIFEVDEINGIPIVLSEKLVILTKQDHKGVILALEQGKGIVLIGKKPHDVSLEDKGRLGITTLGQLSEHPHIVKLRTYVQNWYLSYFIPDAARKLPPTGAQKHLDRTGENLGNVVQYIQRNHKERFERILEQIRKRIPGIQKIETQQSPDGRLLLKFNEDGYKDPFYQQSMSDGTLKMFAYLLLLEDPDPPAFIGIEEPENGLYHKLLEELAGEFRTHAESSKTQILITTHSPYFVNALTPEQVWLMEKDENGHTQVKRTADMPVIKEIIEGGIPLKSLWYSNHFHEPRVRDAGLPARLLLKFRIHAGDEGNLRIEPENISSL